MPNDHPHRGITMHQLRFGAGFPGLVFTIGTALIFLFAIPALWYVLAAALVVGLLMAALLQILHRDLPENNSGVLKL